jgi:hypothetical protein
VVAAIAIMNGKPGLTALGGISGAVFAAINLSTLSASKVAVQASVGGQTIASLDPHVSPAWGSWLVLVVSLVVVMGGFIAARQPAGEPLRQGIAG